MPAGSEGLLILPYFAGERTPVFDPQARGVVAGLSLRHGRGHLFRAAYEGIAFGIRQILEMFGDADCAPDGRCRRRGKQSGLDTGDQRHHRTHAVGSRLRPSAPATAMRCWLRSGPELVQPDTDGQDSVARNSAERSQQGELYEDLYQDVVDAVPVRRKNRSTPSPSSAERPDGCGRSAYE